MTNSIEDDADIRSEDSIGSWVKSEKGKGTTTTSPYYKSRQASSSSGLNQSFLRDVSLRRAVSAESGAVGQVRELSSRFL